MCRPEAAAGRAGCRGHSWTGSRDRFSSFQALTLVMCASYAAVLVASRRLSGRAIGVSIVVAYGLLLVGPPLISQDVFGYLAFARLGALHGLDPYTHVPAEAPTDACSRSSAGRSSIRPMGRCSHLAPMPSLRSGLAGGLWALKALAVAREPGRDRAWSHRRPQGWGAQGEAAAVFVGLNPVLLELAAGGAHNDTLVLLVLAGALALAAGTHRISRRGETQAHGSDGERWERTLCAPRPP